LVLVAIRTAVLADMDCLSEVFRRASLSNEGDRDHLLAHPESLVLSDDGVRQGRTRVAVGPDHHEVVGFASWLVKDGVIELEDLFVEPTWMRRGVGRALVLDAVGIAREQAFDRLEVTANPHAQAFYESTGFIAGRVVETDFYPGQRMHRTVP
jgi:ribosomal protein S18 acetylase RimI-like enzyme